MAIALAETRTTTTRELMAAAVQAETSNPVYAMIGAQGAVTPILGVRHSLDGTCLIIELPEDIKKNNVQDASDDELLEELALRLAIGGPHRGESE